MKKLLSRISIKYVLTKTIMSLIAFILGSNFTALFHQGTSQEGGLWSVVSSVMVLEVTWAETSKSAVFRVVGTFIGALIAGTYLYFYHFNAIGLALCIGVGVTIVRALGIAKYSKLTSLTIAVIMIISVINKDIEPVMNAALRFSESVIGTGVAVMVSYVSFLLFKEDKSPDSQK